MIPAGVSFVRVYKREERKVQGKSQKNTPVKRRKGQNLSTPGRIVARQKGRCDTFQTHTSFQLQAPMFCNLHQETTDLTHINFLDKPNIVHHDLYVLDVGPSVVEHHCKKKVLDVVTLETSKLRACLKLGDNVHMLLLGKIPDA